MSRTFTVDAVTRGCSQKVRFNDTGRYVSDTPIGAAKKAFTQICRKLNKCKGRMTLHYTIRETTEGSAGKLYSYIGRKEFDEKTVIRDGKPITYKYNVKTKSVR